MGQRGGAEGWGKGVGQRGGTEGWRRGVGQKGGARLDPRDFRLQRLAISRQRGVRGVRIGRKKVRVYVGTGERLDWDVIHRCGRSRGGSWVFGVGSWVFGVGSWVGSGGSFAANDQRLGVPCVVIIEDARSIFHDDQRLQAILAEPGDELSRPARLCVALGLGLGLGLG